MILKCLFGDFNFFQKTNENRLHSSKNQFICSFLGRIHGLTICFPNWWTFKLCYFVLISVDLCKMKLKPWVNQIPQIWKSLKFQVQTSKLYAVDLLLHHFLKTLVKTHQCGMLCSWVNIQVFSDATWAQMCYIQLKSNLAPAPSPSQKQSYKEQRPPLLYSVLCSTMLG